MLTALRVWWIHTMHLCMHGKYMWDVPRSLSIIESFQALYKPCLDPMQSCVIWWIHAINGEYLDPISLSCHSKIGPPKTGSGGPIMAAKMVPPDWFWLTWALWMLYALGLLLLYCRWSHNCLFHQQWSRSCREWNNASTTVSGYSYNNDQWTHQL